MVGNTHDRIRHLDVDQCLPIKRPRISQSVPIADNRPMWIDTVEKVDVELTWTPSWNQSMMSEEAQLALGML